MICIDVQMPTNCCDCWIRHNMGCRIANDSGWPNNRRDDKCPLKPCEPRVMTLDEVKAMKRHTICAVEQRSKVLHTTFNAEYYGTITIGQRNYLDFGLYADVNPFRRSEVGYGKTWRCWTSRPTDEQREAVKWE